MYTFSSIHEYTPVYMSLQYSSFLYLDPVFLISPKDLTLTFLKGRSAGDDFPQVLFIIFSSDKVFLFPSLLKKTFAGHIIVGWA